MSHQSGIRATPELKVFFNRCKGGSVRLFRVVINDESLVSDYYVKVSTNWSDDARACLKPSSIQYPNKPCYIFCMLDTYSAGCRDWLMLNYVPNNATVREKMLYASTKATLKQEFGLGNIKYDFHVGDKNDLNFNQVEGLIENQHKMIDTETNSASPLNHSFPTPPLDYSMSKGVRFAVDQNAVEALMKLKRKEFNYVQLSVDVLNEAIRLEEATLLDPEEFGVSIGKSTPRYHFLSLPAALVEADSDKFVFLYSLPKMESSVKERMLYSGCKAPLLEDVEGVGVELKLDVKASVDGDEVIDTKFFRDLFTSPVPVLEKNAFKKPKGPPQQRGQRRL